MKRDSGKALVEMVLVLPVLMLLIIGLMEYGWMFFRVHQITNAAQIIAREAVLPDSTNASVAARASTILGDWGMGSSGYTVVVDPADVTTIDSGTLVKVTVTVPYANVDLMGITIIPLPENVKGSVSMAKEGP